MGLNLNPLVRTIFTLFLWRFDDYVGSVSCFGYGVFVPTGVNPKCDIFAFAVFLPIGVESKVGRLIEMFGAQIPCFTSKFETQFYIYINSLTSPYSLLPLLFHQKRD